MIPVDGYHFLIVFSKDCSMKYMVVFALCLCAFQLTSGEQRKFGRKIGIRRTIKALGRAALPVTGICTDATTSGKAFCNGDPDKICDAEGIVQCAGTGVGFTIPCTGATPYCVSPSAGVANCASTPSAGCSATVPNFQCTGIGFYPDPTNCRVYYNCYKNDAGDIVPEALLCDSGYVFDPNSPTKMYCLYTSTASRCVTEPCKGVTTVKNVVIPYSGNSQYVALCIPGDPDAHIYQCPTGTKPNLDVIPVTCTFTCKSAGLYPYSPDNLFYYECKIDSGTNKLTPTAALKECPINYYFDTNQCVQKPGTP